MQIQRIQSLWLLIACVCAVVSLCFPWLKIGGGFVSVENDIPLMIISLLATIFPLLAIFMYRNLSRQKLVCSLAAIMAILAIGYTVALSYLGPNPESDICFLSPVLMAFSGIFDMLGRRAIIHDEKLLRSADRLR